MGAESGVDADQYYIRVTIRCVDNNRLARSSTALPANPVARDNEIASAKLGRTDDARPKPGKPGRTIDKGVILVKETASNSVIAAIGHIHNGVQLGDAAKANSRAFIKVMPKQKKTPARKTAKPAQKETPKKKLRKKAVPEAKVGRNDPCPCGSGKKYKKCCGTSS